jgi:hypothetical protein
MVGEYDAGESEVEREAVEALKRMLSRDFESKMPMTRVGPTTYYW